MVIISRSDLIRPPESLKVKYFKSRCKEDHAEVFLPQISCDPPNHPYFSKADLEELSGRSSAQLVLGDDAWIN